MVAAGIIGLLARPPVRARMAAARRARSRASGRHAGAMAGAADGGRCGARLGPGLPCAGGGAPSAARSAAASFAGSDLEYLTRCRQRSLVLRPALWRVAPPPRSQMRLLLSSAIHTTGYTLRDTHDINEMRILISCDRAGL